jgi:hypothetical protein
MLQAFAVHGPTIMSHFSPPKPASQVQAADPSSAFSQVPWAPQKPSGADAHVSVQTPEIFT